MRAIVTMRKVLYIAVIGLYLFFIINNFLYKVSVISVEFGAVDPTLFQSSVNAFSLGKMPYYNYYFEYGWLFAGIYALPYILLGKTFFALQVSGFLVLPILSLILSTIIAKIVLKKDSTILTFLLLNLLFYTNYDFVSLRHLVAELSLALFIFGTAEHDKKILTLSGLFGGIAVLCGFEYSIALTITVIITSLFLNIQDPKKALIYIYSTLKWEATISGIFFLWLFANGALTNFVKFSLDFMHNYYYSNPCALESFIRLPISIPLNAFFQGSMLYVAPVIYVCACFFALYHIIKRKSTATVTMTLITAVYGSLIYFRTLNTPCIDYFSYGLIPLFLIVSTFVNFILQKVLTEKKWRIKVILIALLIGIVLYFYSAHIVNPRIIKQQTGKQVFYAPAGHIINKNTAEAYVQINDFIANNTGKDDYLYVYPWGIYNITSQRKSPTAFITLVQAQIVGDSAMNQIVADLDRAKPKYIVINNYNNLSVTVFGTKRLDVPFYTSLSSENGPVFAGNGNQIEKYILNNYKTVLSNPSAIIMEKREIPLSKKFGVDSGKCTNLTKNEFKVTRTSGNSGWEISFNNPSTANYMEVTQMLDADILTKYISRYVLKYTINGMPILQNYLSRREQEIVALRWQDHLLVKTTVVEVDRNTGFMWFLKPGSYEVNNIKICLIPTND